uniref:Uncharacterized protein n=1 Tax=Brassica oleracea TaxID=3712 RepID=A0A3P6DF31_BRAOL|nr:unnamed protein product [Brassica oleracea]
MCQKHRPGLVFLSETKNRRLLLQNIQADLRFDHLFTVEPLSLSGGLALLFTDEFQVNVLFSNNRMIEIEAVIDGIKVFMTFVYGDPVLERREHVWERLTRFSTTRNGTWFMIADILTKPVRRKKKFKFDKRWLDNEELRQVILAGWKSEDLPP